MPLYLFKHPETGETKDVVQKMKDPHVFFDDDGVEWARVWVVPNAAIDNNICPFSASDFVEKTKNMKGTVGDLWDMAGDLSGERIDKEGRDAIKEGHDKWRKAKIAAKRRKNMKADISAAKKNKKKKK